MKHAAVGASPVSHHCQIATTTKQTVAAAVAALKRTASTRGANVVVAWLNVALIMHVIDIVAAEHERGPPSRHQRSMRSWAQAKAKAKTRAQRAQKHLSLASYRVRSMRRKLNSISVLSLLRRRPSEGAESSATSQAAGLLLFTSMLDTHM